MLVKRGWAATRLAAGGLAGMGRRHAWGVSRDGCARLVRGVALVLLAASSATATTPIHGAVALVLLSLSSAGSSYVNMGSAGGVFALVSKAAIAGTASTVSGDVGSLAAINFAPQLIDASTGTFSTSTQVPP
jgi:hypothetical protein